MKSNKRTFFLLILLALVAVIGIPMIKSNLSSGEAVDTAASLADSSQSVRLLAQFEQITLDFSVFKSPEFDYLSDFTLPLVNVQIGRLNPFAALR